MISHARYLGTPAEICQDGCDIKADNMLVDIWLEARVDIGIGTEAVFTQGREQQTDRSVNEVAVQTDFKKGTRFDVTHRNVPRW